MVRKWQNTTRPLSQWTQWFHDTVWFLDDATRIRADQLADQVYWLASGNPPGARIPTKGIVLSTSERPLPAHPEGLRARVLDWDQSWIPPHSPVDQWLEWVERPEYWGWMIRRLLRHWDQHSPWAVRRALHRATRFSAEDGLIQRWEGYWNTLRAGIGLWQSPVLVHLFEEVERQWWKRKGITVV